MRAFTLSVLSVFLSVSPSLSSTLSLPASLPYRSPHSGFPCPYKRAHTRS